MSLRYHIVPGSDEYKVIAELPEINFYPGS